DFPKLGTAVLHLCQHQPDPFLRTVPVLPADPLSDYRRDENLCLGKACLIIKACPSGVICLAAEDRRPDGHPCRIGHFPRTKSILISKSGSVFSPDRVFLHPLLSEHVMKILPLRAISRIAGEPACQLPVSSGREDHRSVTFLPEF